MVKNKWSLTLINESGDLCQKYSKDWGEED